MRIVERKVFITCDGREFLDQEKAFSHEAQVKFKHWYAKNQLINNVSIATANGIVALVQTSHEDIISWLKENKKHVHKLLTYL